MAAFEPYFINELLPIEGGWSEVSGDKGKATYCGISYVYHPEFPGWPIIFAYKEKYGLKRGQIIKDPVLEKMVKDFYKKNYWDAVKADLIKSDSIAKIIVDWKINGGLSIKDIQKYLKVSADGVVGSGTIEAINEANPSALFNYIKSLRAAHYNKIVLSDPTQKKFYDGWMNRLSRFTFENSTAIGGAGLAITAILIGFVLLK